MPFPLGFPLSRISLLSLRVRFDFQHLRMASSLPRLPIFEAITSHHPQSTAIVHNPSGRAFTYGELSRDVADATEALKNKAGRRDLFGERIAFLVENGYDYVGARRSGDAARLSASALTLI